MTDGQVFCGNAINTHYVPDTVHRAEDIKANDAWALTPENAQPTGKYTA